MKECPYLYVHRYLDRPYVVANCVKTYQFSRPTSKTTIRAFILIYVHQLKFTFIDEKRKRRFIIFFYIHQAIAYPEE